MTGKAQTNGHAARKRRRSASSYKGYNVVLAPKADDLGQDDPLLILESEHVDGVQIYADGGDRPEGYHRFEVDPRLADVWFRRMGVAAAAVQWRAMVKAMEPQSSPLQVQNGLRAAMEVQNRLFGKPIEKMAVAGRVKIEFGGLNPDAFPKEAREAKAEVVDIPADAGTEVDGEG